MAEITLEECLQKAEEYINTGQSAEAIAYCQHMLAYFPQALTVHRLLGEAYLAEGSAESLAQAQQEFATILTSDPENTVAHCGQAKIYTDENNPEGALTALKCAFELDQSDLQIKKGLIHFAQQVGRGNTLERTRAGLARLYMSGDLLTPATREWEMVLTAEPERLDAQLGLIETYWRQNRSREAANLCRSVLSTHPTCLKANAVLGAILYINNQQDQALPYLSQAEALDPEHVLAHSLFGRAQPVGLSVFSLLPLNKQLPHLPAPPGHPVSSTPQARVVNETPATAPESSPIALPQSTPSAFPVASADAMLSFEELERSFSARGPGFVSMDSIPGGLAAITAGEASVPDHEPPAPLETTVKETSLDHELASTSSLIPADTREQTSGLSPETIATSQEPTPELPRWSIDADELSKLPEFVMEDEEGESRANANLSRYFGGQSGIPSASTEEDGFTAPQDLVADVQSVWPSWLQTMASQPIVDPLAGIKPLVDPQMPLSEERVSSWQPPSSLEELAPEQDSEEGVLAEQQASSIRPALSNDALPTGLRTLEEDEDAIYSLESHERSMGEPDSTLLDRPLSAKITAFPDLARDHEQAMDESPASAEAVPPGSTASQDVEPAILYTEAQDTSLTPTAKILSLEELERGMGMGSFGGPGFVSMDSIPGGLAAIAAGEVTLPQLAPLEEDVHTLVEAEVSPAEDQAPFESEIDYAESHLTGITELPTIEAHSPVNDVTTPFEAVAPVEAEIRPVEDQISAEVAAPLPTEVEVSSPDLETPAGTGAPVKETGVTSALSPFAILFNEAERYQQSGDIGQALARYRQLLHLHPEENKRVINTLLTLSSNSTYKDIHRVLGDAYLQREEYLHALDAYNRAHSQL